MTRAELVEAIHRSATRLVLTITGGGAEVIGELLRRGGGSRTLLEATVPYHPEAFRRRVGGLPDHLCSAEAARDLAMAAFRAARELAPGEPVIGVGATCALAKEDERPGRRHRIFVALQSADATITRALALEAGRDREDEEAIVADLVLDAIAEGCGVAGRLAIDLAGTERIERAEARPVAAVAAVVAGGADRAAHVLCEGGPAEPTLLFPGSFRPLHEGHVRMAEIARELTGEWVDFEIAAVNVDKPPLNYDAARQRLEGFDRLRTPGFGRVWFTRAPTFREKARLFPGARFLVGFDTLARIGDPKYAPGPDDLDRLVRDLEAWGTRFLVFHRLKPDGRISTHEDLQAIHPGLVALATVVPEHRVADIAGIASRHIRARNQADQD